MQIERLEALTFPPTLLPPENTLKYSLSVTMAQAYGTLKTIRNGYRIAAKGGGMLTYSWEWVSDLALIPAWELFLSGVIIGLSIGLILYARRNK